MLEYTNETTRVLWRATPARARTILTYDKKLRRLSFPPLAWGRVTKTLAYLPVRTYQWGVVYVTPDHHIQPETQIYSLFNILGHVYIDGSICFGQEVLPETDIEALFFNTSFSGSTQKDFNPQEGCWAGTLATISQIILDSNKIGMALEPREAWAALENARSRRAALENARNRREAMRAAVQAARAAGTS